MTKKYYVGQKRVYWNVTRKCYSVQVYIHNKGWRLGYHTDSLVVDIAYGDVSEKTRNRVITENKKYVHAWLYGHITDTRDYKDCMKQSNKLVKYNPYKHDRFKVFNMRGEEVADLNSYYNPSIYCSVVDGKPQMYLSYE